LDHIDDHLPRSRAAIAQLERSLQRLETVVAKGHHGDLFLEQELRAAKADYARLDETSRLVEERLDVAVNRLRSVLED
jgi:archaellum biogenesis protein FlaJ (TadC family)